MADNKYKTKAELLDELESIKSLLLEQGGDAADLPSPHDVPLLNQVVDKDNNSGEPMPPVLTVTASYEGATTLNTGELTTTDLSDYTKTVPEDKQPHSLENVYSTLSGPADEEQELDEIRQAYHDAISEPPLPFYGGAATNCDKTIDIEEKIAETLADEQSLATPEPEAQKASAATSPLNSGNQQSLFELSDDTPAVVTTKELPKAELVTPKPDRKRRQSRPIPKPTGENPFLPQHIRDRLQANRAPGNQPPALTVEPLYRENLEHHAERLLSEVIKEFLPKIEAELHSRLQALIKDHLNELNE